MLKILAGICLIYSNYAVGANLVGDLPDDLVAPINQLSPILTDNATENQKILLRHITNLVNVEIAVRHSQVRNGLQFLGISSDLKAVKLHSIDIDFEKSCFVMDVTKKVEIQDSKTYRYVCNLNYILENGKKGPYKVDFNIQKIN